MAIEQIAMTEGELADGGTHRAALRLVWEWLLSERDDARVQARTLAEASQRMDEFLGIVAHELRTPVTSSHLAVALAGRRVDALLVRLFAADVELAGQVVPIRDLLSQAEDGMERLTRLVADLLDGSRIQAGGFDLRLTHCDLAALVSEAVEEQRQIAPDRDIRLHVPDRPIDLVLADAGRIKQVVTNYLTNALRYSQDDRPVDVRVQVLRDWARVDVRDRGPGLPRAEQQRIWERFHRAAGISVVSGASAGLGLGLHICKTIVEQHRGRIGLRSAPGKGSTFWFALAVAGTDPHPKRGTGNP
jgi:signal transduction histidine kinase